MNNRSRYTVNDVNNNRFYQMPIFLFEGEFKKGINNDAKILYSLLRDRHNLSMKNNWINENGEVYLIYTREDMADMLGISQPTLRNAIKQLKEHGLMEEEHMGLNRANRIYLTTVTIEITGVKDSFSPECKDLSFRDENILQSRVKDSFSQECKILSPNKTNINNTNYSNTNINDIDIYQSIDTEIKSENIYDSPPMDGHDIQNQKEIKENKNYYKNSLPVEELNRQIEKVGFKSYNDLIYDLNLTETVYPYPYVSWIPTVKKVIWEMYYLDTRIRNRTLGRYDVITKLQDLDIEVVKSSLDKIIEIAKREEITYPVPLLKTIVFNEIDEFMARIQAQVDYDMNNDFRHWDL